MVWVKKMTNIYKLYYTWYEGEYADTYIVTGLETQEFEALLKKGIIKISYYPESKSLLKKEKNKFAVKCLPEAFDKMKDYLEENGCLVGDMDFQTYEIDDGSRNNFIVKRTRKTTIREEL